MYGKVMVHLMYTFNPSSMVMGCVCTGKENPVDKAFCTQTASSERKHTV